MATSMQLDQPQSDPIEYLTLISSSPDLPNELEPFYHQFSVLYHNKLWYQLTTTLEAFLTLPSSSPYQTQLWTQFILDFSTKINPLKLVTIGISVARQYQDGAVALSFLESLSTKVSTPDTQEAFILATMETAHFKLLLGDMAGTKEAMEQCGKIVEAMDSVERSVNASYYRVSGDYYKAKAEYANYYKNSLLYLACVSVDKDLSPVERVQRAHDLGISALLGTIYNFGELLLHPILESLVGTEHDWIKNVLFAFNAGDIGQFESLVPQLSKEPILQDSYPFLRQKICLMALIEAVFKRPTTDRVLPFSVIAAETRLPADEVEHLVMKALSLNLIHGAIDQVSSTVAISWVQPRVLSMEQIAGLGARLTEWCDKVTGVGAFTKIQAPELFV